jgi:DNA-binding transcriptional MerR regulator
MATGEEARPAQPQGFLTIEELAARVGMSTRNIRAHRSRGLLPPPVVRGRVGLYGSVHLARLKLIKTLQEFGFNLTAIAAVLEHGSTYSEFLEFLARLRARVTEGTSAADWVELPQDSVDLLREISPELPEELVARGALRRSPQGGYSCHPTMFGSAAFGSAALESAAERAQHGMSASAMTRVMQEVLRCVERVAALLANELAAISPAHDLTEIERLLDDAAPLATELYVTAFEIALPELLRQELFAMLRQDDS